LKKIKDNAYNSASYLILLNYLFLHSKKIYYPLNDINNFFSSVAITFKVQNCLDCNRYSCFWLWSYFSLIFS